MTSDVHPIHTHLARLMNRQAFNVTQYRALYDSLFPGGGWEAQLADGSWGVNTYPAGVYIPAYGPPMDIGGSDERSGGKLVRVRLALVSFGG